jgi:hypothetical protein
MSTMRNYSLAALLFLAAIAQAGCIFEPRTAEPPGGGTEQYPWIVPTRPKDVFVNLASGLASNLDSNYERSLDAAFAFIPSADAEAIYPGSFDGWNKAVELEFLTRVKTLYVGTRSVQFGDANLNFTSENEQVGLAIYEGTYTITLNLGDGSPAVTYAGIARFTIVQGTQGWVLSIWEDIEASGANPTSGILRGALRS